MNLQTKILNEFNQSNIKIISEEKLIEYIEFCIDKNQGARIKGKTSHHHILPQADSCFPQFKDLRMFLWNGSHLLYSEHYYAHWLFTEAIENYSQLYAFCTMHNRDIKLRRINEKDLIPAAEFQDKMQEFIIGQTNRPEAINKFRKTIRSTVSFNGKEMMIKDVIGEKVSKTKSCSVWKETIGKESIKKGLETLSEKILVDGEITSRRKMANHKAAETKKKRGKQFKVMDKNDKVIFEKINYLESRNISQALYKTSKENFLGKHPASKYNLIKANKEKYIGYYVVEIINT